MEAGLAVESGLDQGSTFTLILPVRELPTAPEAREDEAISAKQHSPEP